MSQWKKDENGRLIYGDRKPRKQKQKVEKEVDTVGKTENFFTRNVKLITFLICLGVFLALFGPLSVFTVKKYLDEKEDTRPVMSEAELVALSELDRDLYFSDLKGYKGREDVYSQKYKVNVADGTEIREKDTEIWYYIDIGKNYSGLAIADIQTEKIIYFQISNRKTQWKADVLNDDIRSFMQGIPVATEPPVTQATQPATETTEKAETQAATQITKE